MSPLFSFEVSFAYLTPKVYMALLLCSFHPNKHPEGFQMKSELLLLCLHFSPLEDSCFLLTQGDVFFCNARLSSQISPVKPTSMFALCCFHSQPKQTATT